MLGSDANKTKANMRKAENTEAPLCPPRKHDRRSFLRESALCLFSLALVRSAIASNEGSSSVSIVDLIPDLVTFLTRHAVEEAATVAAFRSEIIGRNANLYAAFTGSRSDEELAAYLKEVKPLSLTLQGLDQQIRKQVPEMFRRFHEQFSDMKWDGPLFIMGNLFGFDGGGGQLDNRDVLVFGLDTIAKQYGPSANLPVMISHEAFHVYHDQFHPEWSDARRGKDTPLYRLVWKEGLAVFASGQLNTAASESDLLLSSTLQRECEQRFAALCRTLREVLDTTDRTNFLLWMSGSSRTESIPPRAGYYIGQSAVIDTAKRLSTPAMARLDDAGIRAAIMSFLNSSV